MTAAAVALQTYALAAEETHARELVLFQEELARVERREGGFYDGRDPRDPNPTNIGITLTTLRTLGVEGGDLDGDGDVDVADLRRLSARRDVLERLYRVQWRAGECDQLVRISGRIARAHFDAVVNHGPGSRGTREAFAVRGRRWRMGANHLLQRAFGCIEDGIIGPMTLKHVRTFVLDRWGEDRAVRAMLVERKHRYVTLLRANPKLRGNVGWRRRLNDVCAGVGIAPVWTEPFEVWQ